MEIVYIKYMLFLDIIIKQKLDQSQMYGENWAIVWYMYIYASA
mgnify:FL=1